MQNMLAIPWYVAVFESFPEAFLIIIVGFKLFNITLSTKNALLIAALSALSLFLIRQAPIVFGLHTFLAIAITIFLAVLITRLDLWSVTLAILAGIVLLAILQSLMIPALFQLTGLQFSDIPNQPWLNIVLFIPQGVVLVGIYLLIRQKNWYLYDLGQKDTECA